MTKNSKFQFPLADLHLVSLPSYCEKNFCLVIADYDHEDGDTAVNSDHIRTDERLIIFYFIHRDQFWS